MKSTSIKKYNLCVATLAGIILTRLVLLVNPLLLFAYLLIAAMAGIFSAVEPFPPGKLDKLVSAGNKIGLEFNETMFRVLKGLFVFSCFPGVAVYYLLSTLQIFIRSIQN